MSLGERIAFQRKKKKLSQNELGKKVGTSGDIIGRYERDEVKPSIEIASKIGDILEVSLDYLMGKTEMELDKISLKRMAEIAALPEDYKKQVFMVLDALLRDFKAKQAYS